MIWGFGGIPPPRYTPRAGVRGRLAPDRSHRLFMKNNQSFRIDQTWFVGVPPYTYAWWSMFSIRIWPRLPKSKFLAMQDAVPWGGVSRGGVSRGIYPGNFRNHSLAIRFEFYGVDLPSEGFTQRYVRTSELFELFEFLDCRNISNCWIYLKCWIHFCLTWGLKIN